MAARYAAYVVRLPFTAITAGKTLIQVKAGNAPLEIVSAKLFQTSKILSEQLNWQILRKSAAATVTAFTPLKLDPNDPTALSVGGTSATGNNASAEGTDGDVLDEGVWNVLNGQDASIVVPEERGWVPAAGIFALKLITSPAASMNIGGYVRYLEYL